MILGLDISTSITGYCLINTDMPSGHRLIIADGIIISHEKDTYAKSVIIRNIFLSLSEKYKVDSIMIEENLQAFRRGLSSAKTLSTLARFNGIVSFIAQDVFHVPTTMINVNHARKSIGLKTNRKIKKEVSIKEQVVSWIKEQPDFKNYNWPTKTLKSGPRKGQTILAPRCFDIADAAVVCLSGLHI